LTAHVLPILGRKWLTALTPAELRLLLTRLSSQAVNGHSGTGEPLAPRTVQQIHAVMRTMLNHAVREEVLARNVVRLVQAHPLPSRTRSVPGQTPRLAGSWPPPAAWPGPGPADVDATRRLDNTGRAGPISFVALQVVNLRLCREVS